MSYADEQFINTAKRILEEGTLIPVRPVWEDTGEQAKVKKIFDVHTVYDLSKGEFPALTLRPINLKAAINEVLWIYQKKSNNINELYSHIWDSWATSDHKIGLAYGYQIGNRFRTVTNEIKGGIETVVEPLQLDQMDFVLWELTHNPNSRRIITDMYNIDDLSRMGLDPCAFLTQWNTRKVDGTTYLDMILYQRSQDFLVANNWNVCQYCAFLIMVARSVGMMPGKFTHQIADCHIYDRHIPIVEELIKREPYEAPTYINTMKYNNDPKTFYLYDENHIKLENYKRHSQIKNIPVAV